MTTGDCRKIDFDGAIGYKVTNDNKNIKV